MMTFVRASTKFFELWKLFQGFTDTSTWSDSSQVRIQCQQKHGCGKSTHNDFKLLNISSTIT